jgi:hypothetical protein
MGGDPGRVSHVLYCFEPERLERAAAFWRDTFGVCFDEVDAPGSGLRILFSLQSGLELIAPVDDAASLQYRSFLDATGGGGLFGLVYKVDDVEEAAAKAGDAGVETVRRISYTGRVPWSEQYEVLEEAILAEHENMRVVIGQIELRPPPDGT